MNPIEISAHEFRQLAEQIADLAAEYLDQLDAQPISPATRGEETVRLFQAPLPEAGMGKAALTSLHDVIRLSRAQNGRFFGYVLGSGEPVAAVADLLASVLNQNVTAWRSGPAAVVIERTVVSWLAEAIGCGGFSGHLTGGGSSANLMALALARESKTPANEKGVKADAVVYASSEVHMSMPKSIALLGIGRDHLRLIETDDSFRMIPAKLEAAILRDRAAGKTPIAVVASAGTVNTGAIDPLRQIAEIAHRQGAWLHIDGAYGALAAMAEPRKFDGIELADSISLDPHKWLYQPTGCGCLLYRDPAAARAAFSHSGEYARSLSADPIEGFAFFEESIELTRPFRALGLWLSLRYHGLGAFAESIGEDLRLAQVLADRIDAEPLLERLAPVPLSAVCFRHRGTARDGKDLNPDILQRVIQRGRVYLSNARLNGQFSLRACIVNHRTTDDDVAMVVSEVLAAAQEVPAG